VNNVEDVLAIEFLAACQGIDFRAPLKPGEGTLKIYRKIREKVKKMNEDRVILGDLIKVKELMRTKFGF
jgi:histidine ammonia-lyase